MTDLLNFVMQNYTWLLAIAIIILLAIIGYYADETNFGQGKHLDEDKKINNEFINDNFQTKDAINISQANVQSDLQNASVNSETVVSPQLYEQKSEVVSAEPTLNHLENASESIVQINSDESFKKLNEEFDQVIPEKKVISMDAADLLSDIDNLSLDKTQKLNLSDIPDLDNVDLPEIKGLKKADEDIWKF